MSKNLQSCPKTEDGREDDNDAKAGPSTHTGGPDPSLASDDNGAQSAEDLEAPIIPKSVGSSSGELPLVFVLGMPKCGTTSLHQALQYAGWTSVHWALDHSLAFKECGANTRLRTSGYLADERLIAKLIWRAREEGLPPLANLPKDVNAVAEMNGLYWESWEEWKVWGFFPQMSMLKDLFSSYPDARFILNVRDPVRWVASVGKHNDMRLRLVVADLPGLPSGVGRSDWQLVEWVENHHKRVKEEAAASGVKLLVFDVEKQGAAELGEFLGRPVKWEKHNASRN